MLSHFSAPGSVSFLIASTGHSGSQTPQSIHSGVATYILLADRGNQRFRTLHFDFEGGEASFGLGSEIVIHTSFVRGGRKARRVSRGSTNAKAKQRKMAVRRAQ